MKCDIYIWGDISFSLADQYKAINDEGMPRYGRPFIKGQLYIHFNVIFPESGFLSLDKCRALEAILPTRLGKRSSGIELEKCEETTMHDVNIDEAMSSVITGKRLMIQMMKSMQICIAWVVTNNRSEVPR